jgi:activator of 2-hydroxyglutaryl-CoA dehydratase
MNSKVCRMGLDVGSTTVKCVVLDDKKIVSITIEGILAISPEL